MRILSGPVGRSSGRPSRRGHAALDSRLGGCAKRGPRVFQLGRSAVSLSSGNRSVMYLIVSANHSSTCSGSAPTTPQRMMCWNSSSRHYSYGEARGDGVSTCRGISLLLGHVLCEWVEAAVKYNRWGGHSQPFERSIQSKAEGQSCNAAAPDELERLGRAQELEDESPGASFCVQGTAGHSGQANEPAAGIASASRSEHRTDPWVFSPQTISVGCGSEPSSASSMSSSSIARARASRWFTPSSPTSGRDSARRACRHSPRSATLDAAPPVTWCGAEDFARRERRIAVLRCRLASSPGSSSSAMGLISTRRSTRSGRRPRAGARPRRRCRRRRRWPAADAAR